MTDTVRDTARAMAEEQEARGARSPALEARTLHAVGHFHLDPLWLWDKSDGLERFRSTTRGVLDLMDRNPELNVAASSAALYDYVRRVDPELFARLAARVREGRWEPVGGMWIEPDEHVPSGEGYVRQLLLGQEFFARHFGRIARVAWSPDSFGRYSQLPRLLAGSGLEYFIFKRPERSQKALPDVFYWAAGDGSRILTCHIHEYLTWGASLPRLVRRVARDLREPLRHGLLLFGVGNHGGGPTQENIDELHRLQSDPGLPHLVFSTPEAFFRRLAESGVEFPTVLDHLDYFVGGGYTSHARLKKAFRQTENLLVMAEAAAAMRGVLANTPRRAAADLARAWQQVAFNHFHDTAAGTCIPEVYPSVLDELAEARSIARTVTLESLHALAGRMAILRVDGAQPLVVFNVNGHAIRQFVAANVQLSELPPATEDPTLSHCLLTADGEEVPVQRVHSTAMPSTWIGFVAEVPALGYTTLQLVPRPAGPSAASLEDLPAPEFGLENAHYLLTLDPTTGTIARLYDKVHQLEVFSGPAARPMLVADEGNAWGARRYERELASATFRPISFRRTQHGPLLSALQVRYALERDGVPTRTTLLQEFRLYRDLEQVDVRVQLDWHERSCALKLAFPVFIKQYAEVTAEVPYATAMYPVDGVEVPGLSWVDVTGESDYTAAGVRWWHGLTLANDAKYSYSFTSDRANQTAIHLTVARGNAYTFTAEEHRAHGLDIAYEDEGEQAFRYALLPHVEGWREAVGHRRAVELNRPATVVTESAHPGSLPPAGSLLSLSHPNIVLGALKHAETGDDLVLRLYEAHGEQTRGVRCDCWGVCFVADFAPHEVKTFRVPLSGSRPAVETDLLERPTRGEAVE